MATRMQQRRDTAAQWTSTNPVLAAGEWGVESDTGKAKVGNGSTAWASLTYVAVPSAAADADITAAVAASRTAPWITVVTGLAVDGTGASGNKTIIDAAIAACPDGGTVLFPAGDIAFNALAAFTKGITFAGAGWWCTNFGALFGHAGWAAGAAAVGGTVLRPANTSGTSISWAGTQSKQFNMRDLAIVGPGSGTPTLVSNGAGVTVSAHCCWSNVLLANGYVNLDWSGGLDSVMTGITSAASGSKGIAMRNNANQTVWVNIQSIGHTGIGIEIAGSTLVSMYGASIQAGAAGSTGVKLTSSANGCLLADFYFENTLATYALDIDSGSSNIIERPHFGTANDAIRINGGATQIRTPQQNVGPVTLTASSTNTVIDGTGWTVTDNSNGQVQYTYLGYPKSQVGSAHSIDLTAEPASKVGTWAYAAGTKGEVQYNSTAALNDSATFDIFVLTTGIYKLNLMCEKFTDAAIMTIQIDGVTIDTHDLYAAAAAVSRYSSGATAITLHAGWHTITVVALTKNASSSAYAMRLKSATVLRTA